MAENAKVLSKKVLTALVSLSTEIVGLMKTGIPSRVWSGKQDVKYPASHKLAGQPVVDVETGEIKKRITQNLDLSVPKELFLRVSKALEAINGSGQYIKINYHNVELVCIKARLDEGNGRFIIQFAKPNSGQWDESTTGTFAQEFDKVFGGKAPAPKTPSTNGEVDEENEDLPF